MLLKLVIQVLFYIKLFEIFLPELITIIAYKYKLLYVA